MSYANHQPRSGESEGESFTDDVITTFAFSRDAERWRVTDGSRRAAEEVPLSKGKVDGRKSVRREPRQGHRNDTDPVQG